MVEILVKVILIMSVLIIFVVPGFILRKTKLVRSESLYSLSNILLCLCQPMLMIKSFAIDPVPPTKGTLLSFLYVLLFSFAALFLTFFVAKLIFCYMKKSEERRKKDIFVFASTISNCAFVGIPFIDMFTDGNSQAIMYMVIFNIAFNIFLWTIGAYLITQDKKQISLRRAFLNPCSVGAVVGFLLFLFPQINIFEMDAVKEFQQIITYTGNMTAPVSMLIVGVRLAELSPKALFQEKGSYISAITRLVISPLVTLLLTLPFKLTGLFANDLFVLIVPAIAMAMPPAASIVAFTEKFDGDRECAAATFVLGTFASFITLPFVLLLIML